MRVLSILLAAFPLALPGLGIPLHAQEPFTATTLKPRRKLQGRFLHITDMHPDPFYRANTKENRACHRGKPKASAKKIAGPYGMPYSDCDSPLSLTNHTLDFLESEWADEIDFVVWTGDSARHDNDRKHPRTTAEIYSLNRGLAKRMEEVFVKRGIPVIPTIGNNDVWPHNIMMPGPNSVTSEFSSMWRAFVPFESYQVFQRGGYFSTEVIPGSLAVISMNTMYFYEANTAVSGCDFHEPQDAGNIQFDWLEVQLSRFRARGIQVWLTGHVPPSAHNFFPQCYIRYVEISLRFQDIILGHLYGHMNADHFFLLDVGQLPEGLPHRPSAEQGLKPKKKELYNLLLKDFAELPDTKNIDHDDYGVVNVGPAVVPNPYLPSFRTFVYNLTGAPYVPATDLAPQGHGRSLRGSSASLCATAVFEQSWRCNLTQVWSSSPESPSRTNRLWTPLGYAQYYIPDLNLGDPPKFRLEYLTFTLAAVHGTTAGPMIGAEVDVVAKKYELVPRRHLPRSLRNSTATKSKYAPYGMADLTIPSWTGLARRLGRVKERKLRERFRAYMYMGAV